MFLENQQVGGFGAYLGMLNVLLTTVFRAILLFLIRERRGVRLGRALIVARRSTFGGGRGVGHVALRDFGGATGKKHCGYSE